MMLIRRALVNPRTGDDEQAKKKPGSKEPGLRYWPREADTITFQEGLLSFRAAGGGGHMRDANAQRASTMIPIGALHQPPEPHVSHAESRGVV
jgi:hypothetical protein